MRRPLRIRPEGEGDERRSRVRFVVLATAVAAAAAAGYAGYVAYPRFDLPAPVGAGLLTLAAGAGVASFFSPCSFPLVFTILSRTVVDRDGRGRAAVRFALAFSIGAMAFVLALGTLIALGGRGLAGSVTFTSGVGIAIRAVVGVALIVLGLAQAGVVPLSFHAVERRLRALRSAEASLRRRRPFAGAVLFGFLYLAIGFG